jgi:hypothetical protein
METATGQLVTEAVQGNRESLEEIIRRIQGKVYGLMKDLDELGRVSALYKASVLGKASADFSGVVKELVDKGEYRVFSELHWGSKY